MKRKIIHIDESKCNGCGTCVNDCHESAIEIVNGIAKLVSDEYCDGLGDCLHCPQDAIQILEREAKEYDDDAVKERQEKLKSKKETMTGGCPGTRAMTLNRHSTNELGEVKKTTESNSELRQWPIELSLVGTKAPYLQEADILVAADCTAFAYADFHKDFLKGRILLVGCPKLDDANYYKEKLGEIFKNNNVKSITVVRMEVPCCGGIVFATKQAMLESGTTANYSEYIISTDGKII